MSVEQEVICTITLPLPASLVAAIGSAIVKAAKQEGYAATIRLIDGSNRIVATDERGS